MAAAGLSPAGDGLGCELTSVWLQPADVSTISWSNFATVVLRAAAATGVLLGAVPLVLSVLGGALGGVGDQEVPPLGLELTNR